MYNIPMNYIIKYKTYTVMYNSKMYWHIIFELPFDSLWIGQRVK